MWHSWSLPVTTTPKSAYNTNTPTLTFLHLNVISWSRPRTGVPRRSPRRCRSISLDYSCWCQFCATNKSDLWSSHLLGRWFSLRSLVASTSFFVSIFFCSVFGFWGFQWRRLWDGFAKFLVQFHHLMKQNIHCSLNVKQSHIDTCMQGLGNYQKNSLQSKSREKKTCTVSPWKTNRASLSIRRSYM